MDYVPLRRVHAVAIAWMLFTALLFLLVQEQNRTSVNFNDTHACSRVFNLRAVRLVGQTLNAMRRALYASFTPDTKCDQCDDWVLLILKKVIIHFQKVFV